MENNKDMFNRLPSSLLVAIVSYLPIKEAARTSILSKQWHSIWRETTNLEFNETFFFVNHEESQENQRIQRNNFVEFVGQFLQEYPQKSIQRFTMLCSKPDNFLTRMKSFVLFAVSRNVRELELDFSDPNWSENDTNKYEAVFELPLQAYQNRGIESLKLFMCKFDASVLFTNFGVLKNVSLGWIGIRVACVEALLITCPLLESLSLKKCWGLQHLQICIPDLRLKSLVIDKCNFIQDFIYIDGPKLKFLKYSGRIGNFHMFNQRELVEVDVDFGMEPEFDEVGSLVYDFVQECYSAQVLTVCSVFLQMVPQGEEPFSFQCPLEVRHLILKTAMHFNEYIGMKFMLNSCPHLRVLTLEIGDAKIFSDYEAPFAFNPQEFWSKNLMVEKCLNTSLQVVNVKGFKGSKSEMYVVRYIIYFGRKLKKVNLHLSEHGNCHRDILMANVQRFKTRSHNLCLSIF